MDSKQEVDQQLKVSCSTFIDLATKILIANLEDFLHKVSSWSLMTHIVAILYYLIFTTDLLFYAGSGPSYIAYLLTIILKGQELCIRWTAHAHNGGPTWPELEGQSFYPWAVPLSLSNSPFLLHYARLINIYHWVINEDNCMIQTHNDCWTLTRWR